MCIICIYSSAYIFTFLLTSLRASSSFSKNEIFLSRSKLWTRAGAVIGPNMASGWELDGDGADVSEQTSWSAGGTNTFIKTFGVIVDGRLSAWRCEAGQLLVSQPVIGQDLWHHLSECLIRGSPVCSRVRCFNLTLSDVMQRDEGSRLWGVALISSDWCSPVILSYYLKGQTAS